MRKMMVPTCHWFFQAALQVSGLVQYSNALCLLFAKCIYDGTYPTMTQVILAACSNIAAERQKMPRANTLALDSPADAY